MTNVPTYDQLMWPTLKALKALGGSGSNQEIVDKIIEIERYSEEVQQVPHNEGQITEIEYRAAWARTYLKKIGAINNSSKGVWILLEKGETLNEEDMIDIPRQVNKLSTESRKQKLLDKKNKKNKRNINKINIEIEEENIDEYVEEDWKDQLIERLLQLTPSNF